MKKKIFYRLTIILSLIFLFLITYASTIGLKTNRFNSQIISQIKNIDPNIDAKINDVSIRLNLIKFTLDVKTVGTDLIYKNKIIKIENIKSKISLKSVVNNQFALSEILISTKSLPIKDVVAFIRLLKNDPKLFIVQQFITSGFIVADIKLNFNKFGKIKNNFKVNGLVNDFKISLLDKKISKLNFIFQITNKEFIFNDIRFLLNNKSIISPEILVVKKNKDFFVSGKLSNKNLNLYKKNIASFIDNKFLKQNLIETTFSSNTDFTFKIDQNFRLNNLDIKSKIDLDNLKFNNFLNLKNNFPNINKFITFQNQSIQLKYNKNKVEIEGFGNVFLQKKADIIKYNIISNKEGFLFDANLKISKNPFIIDLLSFEKNKKTTLNLSFKGRSNKHKLFFKEISLSEDKNILLIKDLELSSKYKVNDIGIIKINYLDKDRLYNDVQIKKYDKIYRISGNSLNINKIVSELFDIKSKKREFFNKTFKFNFDIKKIYFDKFNSTNNLKGSLSLLKNEINELNLESEFSNTQKIKFSIKSTDNDEKVITLFSHKAKPFVNRYKFIKGFEDGNLDFYSIKKNGISNSILKIDNFKIQEIPVLAKLLTLASLQGIADLLTGEGIRFTDFEMKFSSRDKLMTIEELYAIGPAISILMEGYIQKDDLISLKGTLVPATTVNRTISSIPLIGSILVGKKVGEGVFGVSFKIKGPPKKLETSVNPIKTLTPRFITRTLEKIKKN